MKKKMFEQDIRVDGGFRRFVTILNDIIAVFVVATIGWLALRGLATIGLNPLAFAWSLISTIVFIIILATPYVQNLERNLN